jgi:hypothetical protein
MSAASVTWYGTNQTVLEREFARLERRLAAAASGSRLHEIYPSADMESPDDSTAAIDFLSRRFGLTSFERDLLLLCAGVEMESALAERCAELSGDPSRPCVTFALAMNVLPEPHWSALAPSSPLRRYRLLRLEGSHALTSSPLQIEERVLHFLAGVNALEPALEGVLNRHPAGAWLAEDHRRLALDLLDRAAPDALLLTGDDPDAQADVAALVARRLGLALYVLRLEDTPASGPELDRFLALWSREASLLPAMLLLQWEGDAPTPAARKLAERAPSPIAIASREPVLLHRSAVRLEIDKVEPLAQRALWREALGETATEIDPLLTTIAGQFRLSAETIASLSERTASEPRHDPHAAGRSLWNACRGTARPMLDLLAERIQPRASWEDLVLPPAQIAALREIAAQSRHRMLVNEQWGFADRGRRGLGLSALFAGPSGTGKTLAAEVLARALDLDLYRIDLSAVVSKYIGETEKNLRRVFDAAETGGVLLLFDEADALFGKRSEVKDSHDRYANIEVGYLLQRMESFQGIAVLTSNLKNTLDKSFQRRIRFFIDFPFPEAVQRAAIWAHAFPAATPTSGLDPAKLAVLGMAGGNIRNIALNAAFAAAADNAAVQMKHVLAATRAEAAKIGRPLLENEIRGWV